jgi:hypothetical protein
MSESRRYWATVFTELDYEPAPVPVSLANARQILGPLHEVDLDLPNAPEGVCDDCGEPSRRLRIGRVCVCSRCALRRTQAMRRAA